MKTIIIIVVIFLGSLSNLTAVGISGIPLSIVYFVADDEETLIIVIKKNSRLVTVCGHFYSEDKETRYLRLLMVAKIQACINQANQGGKTTTLTFNNGLMLNSFILAGGEYILGRDTLNYW